jgi:hypothetical protein
MICSNETEREKKFKTSVEQVILNEKNLIRKKFEAI